MNLIHGQYQWIVIGIQENVGQARVISNKLYGPCLGISRIERLDENIGKKTESLANAISVCQEILAVNHDSVFLHDV